MKKTPVTYVSDKEVGPVVYETRQTAKPTLETLRKIVREADENPALKTSLTVGLGAAQVAGHVFDDFAALHQLDAEWRNRLIWASFLHEVGSISGRKDRHKTGKLWIAQDRTMPLSAIDRAYVALMVRFSRKKDPSADHCEMLSMLPKERTKLIAAVALLRVCIALTSSQEAPLKFVATQVNPGAGVLVKLEGLEQELLHETFKKKVSLFKSVFHQSVKIEVVAPAKPGTRRRVSASASKASEGKSIPVLQTATEVAVKGTSARSARKAPAVKKKVTLDQEGVVTSENKTSAVRKTPVATTKKVTTTARTQKTARRAANA